MKKSEKEAKGCYRELKKKESLIMSLAFEALDQAIDRIEDP